MRCEVRIADVYGGRFDRDAHLPALVDVLDDVVGASRDRRQQGGHELYRIVRFQVSGVIGKQRVRCRV